MSRVLPLKATSRRYHNTNSCVLGGCADLQYEPEYCGALRNKILCLSVVPHHKTGDVKRVAVQWTEDGCGARVIKCLPLLICLLFSQAQPGNSSCPGCAILQLQTQRYFNFSDINYFPSTTVFLHIKLLAWILRIPCRTVWNKINLIWSLRDIWHSNSCTHVLHR